jgi:competence protein ComEC
MLKDQNRSPERPHGLTTFPWPAGAARSGTALLERERPATQPFSIAALPDLRGLLLVALVGAWLLGILLESLVTLSSWSLLLIAGAAGVLAVYTRQSGRSLPLTRWLFLGLLLLACAALGAARLAFANPAGDPAAVSAYIGRGSVLIRGEISAEPDLRNRSIMLEVDASSLSLDNGHTWREVHGLVAVTVTDPNSPYAPDYGDSVEVRGTLEPVRDSPVPVSSSSAQPVAAPTGVFAAMTFPRLTILEHGGGNPVLAWFYALRQRLAQAISLALPEPEGSLLIGILLGLKTGVLRAQYLLFQQTGTVHLVVTSGFKVTVFSGLLAVCATRLLGRRWVLVPLLLGILAYAILSGAGPAAQRAGIMGALVVIAPRLGRAYNVYTALACAALVMSALLPYVLWDVGFQLSLLGTLGIVLLTPFLAGWLSLLLDRAPGGKLSAGLLSVTLAAQLATLPIQIIVFRQISLIAPLTNLLVGPLLGVMLVMGVLVGVGGLLLPVVGACAGWACWPLLWLVYQIISRLASLPFAWVTVGSLDLLLAWVYELALGVVVVWLLTTPNRLGVIEKPFFAHRQSRQTQARWRVAGVVVLLVAAGTTTLATLPDQRLHIAWLDVGTGGQAMLIQTPAGNTVLLDGGANPVALEDALGQQLPFWQHTIDLALLTNPRPGHLDGLMDVLGHYQVKLAGDAGMLHPSAAYAAWRVALEQHGVPYRLLRQGATIQLEPGVALQVLSPGPALFDDEQNEDTNALILRLVSPGLRVLFLGETTESALGAIMTNGSGLRADVVQVALPAGASPAAQDVLSEVLLIAQPALLVVTPASAKTKSASPPVPASPETTRTLSVATTGELALAADGSRWWLES